MKYLLSFIFVFILSVAPTFGFQQFEGIVTHVSDGDTFNVRTKDGEIIKVRLYGIDAPETYKNKNNPGQPFGNESKLFLTDLIKDEYIKLGVVNKDRYGRYVCKAYYKDKLFGEELILLQSNLLASGYAWAYKEYIRKEDKKTYLYIEEGARENKNGLWILSNPEYPPLYRKRIKDK